MQTNVERLSFQNGRKITGNKKPDYIKQPKNEDKTTGRLSIPQVTLPKGGGALKGIDEKFTVNPVNGTFTFNVPLPITKSRGEFAPTLAISYNSGSGNSPFGLGWNLELPSIQRRTDKKLPLYQDKIESDVFIFSGAEDLVPLLKMDKNGQLVLDDNQKPVPDEFSIDGLSVKRYIPRIEGLYARIEKITNGSDTYWKVSSKDNTVTYFGLTKSSRIADPSDSGRIFKWFPEFSFDDKGNCTYYKYRIEDNKENPNIKPQVDVFDKNRFPSGEPLSNFTNTYLEKVHYCNKKPYYRDPQKPYDPVIYNGSYFFEIEFDYFDKTPLRSGLNSERDYRYDIFSDYRAGFDIRTYRLCRSIGFYHCFNELNEDNSDTPYLVRSLDFTYAHFNGKKPANNSEALIEADYITSIQQFGYVKNGTNYSYKALPKMEFDYYDLSWDKTIKDVTLESLWGDPVGISGEYQWTDFYSEGVPGILTEQADAWYYKSNNGNGEFGPSRLVLTKPSVLGLGQGTLQIQDLMANGLKQVVTYDKNMSGYWEATEDESFNIFHPFEKLPNLDLKDPNLKMIDLNGDGMAELLISEDYAFLWYPSLGKEGFDSPYRISKSTTEESGPTVVFADETHLIYLADMTGDGLTDIVRIRNGEVCYWPNLGYGKFGAKITMANPPLFDNQDLYNPEFLHLVDISGTGSTDLLYTGNGKTKAFINMCGNSWGSPVEIGLPMTPPPVSLAVTDLVGNGTACLVWSSPLPSNSTSPMKYIDLMSGRKPYIMKFLKNNLGKETTIQYKSSTEYYLKDKKNSTTWATKLPFPVQCVSRVEVREKVTNTCFVTLYKYHHGYYDHVDREFRGFGLVEQTDSEEFDIFKSSGGSNVLTKELYQDPVTTKTWFNTGAYLSKDRLFDRFKREFYQNDKFNEVHLAPDRIETPDDYITYELIEAYRALKGTVIRQEVYANLDNPQNDPKSSIPFTAVENGYVVKRIQPMDKNRYPVFMVQNTEMLTYSYERNPEDPRISHTLNLNIDRYGNILKTASVVYGRFKDDAGLPQEVKDEQKQHLTITDNSYSNDVIDNSNYRLRLLYDTCSYELTGIKEKAQPGFTYSSEELLNYYTQAKGISYDATPSGAVEKRLYDRVRTIFKNDNLTDGLSLGTINYLAIVHETYRLAFTQNLITNIFATRLDETKIKSGGYKKSSDLSFGNTDEWWLPSGKSDYQDVNQAKDQFYISDIYTDSFGNQTKITYYKDYYLLVSQAEDAANSKMTVDRFNFRILSPEAIIDSNGNRTEVRFDCLGMVVGTALYGKGSTSSDTEADHFDGFLADLDQSSLDSFFTDPVQNGSTLIKKATARIVYDYAQIPAKAATIARETHYKNEAGNESSLKYSFEYSDGFGKKVMEKIPAEPGDAFILENGVLSSVFANSRWIGTGRTVFNNKGNEVMEFEPYFSQTHLYEDAKELVEIGVSPVLYYDPMGRLYKTEFPNGTYGKVDFDNWLRRTYDENDNVKSSTWYNDRINGDYGSQPYARDGEKDAAQKASYHDATPLTEYLDSLGRSIYYSELKSSKNNANPKQVNTFLKLDIKGNLLYFIDARGNKAMDYRYDIVGNLVKSGSIDAGDRWVFNDCTGNTIYQWDSRNQTFAFTFDGLRRPLEMKVSGGENGVNLDNVYEKIIYGEGQQGDQDKNLRGKIVCHYDTAGKMEYEKYDFKGNPIKTHQKLLRDYKSVPNWSLPNPDTYLGDDIFNSQTSYDALNRVISASKEYQNVTDQVQNIYDKSGRLKSVKANNTPYIVSIDYNSKGQRLVILYGNGTSTVYEYDTLTFRLKRLKTNKSKNSNSKLVQDCYYFYDPVGNITRIYDSAVHVKFFNNSITDGTMDYEYDSMYRLLSASGREHQAQGSFGSPDNWNDFDYTKRYSPNDDMALRNYTQTFQYDDVGNLQKMQHIAGAGSWTRDYNYNHNNNQLINTTIGSDTYNYTYHPTHGFVTYMPHLQTMSWNFKDELQSASQQLSNSGTPEITYFIYDSNGQRVRKVTEYASTSGNHPLVKCDRIYLGWMEFFLDYSPKNNGLVRKTLHIMDDQSRVAMVETRNEIDDGSPKKLVRYQLDNHLGSSYMELDENESDITYEEYHPYGTTAYQAVNKDMKAIAKRYKYTGKERDEETGLYYYGARYYAPWLGLWTSCDQKISVTYSSAYVYVKDRPIIMTDPDGRDDDWSKKLKGLSNDVSSKVKKAREMVRSADDKITSELDGINQRYWNTGNALTTQLATDVCRNIPLHRLIPYLPGISNPDNNYPGFVWNPTETREASAGIFYSKRDALQRIAGYYDFYDRTTYMIAAFIDYEPIRFRYGNRDWKIELWKGRYGVTVGGEIGIYVGQHITGTDTASAEDKDMLHMQFQLVNKRTSKEVFHREGTHWWLTGFKPCEPGTHADLVMKAKIWFKDANMRNAMYDSMVRMGYAPVKEAKGAEFGISFNFDQPKTRQSKETEQQYRNRPAQVQQKKAVNQ